MDEVILLREEHYNELKANSKDIKHFNNLLISISKTKHLKASRVEKVINAIYIFDNNDNRTAIIGISHSISGCNY